MTDVEQKVRAQAEEWGAEVAVRNSDVRADRVVVTLYAEPGTRFTSPLAGRRHALTAWGDTEEEAWGDVWKAMQEGIEDCPSHCECWDD